MKTMSATPELTDPELLALVRGGDPSAYGRLVSRHQTLVVSLAYSICGDFARSQDIAQEAFVAAWRQLPSLEEPAKFKSWLCGITRNLGYNFVRRQIRRADHPPASRDTSPEAAADTPGPREHAVTREEAAIVWHALEQLPENYREPLVLFYREHHSVERVAVALDLSEDVVKQRLARGRGLLRDQVETLIERSLGFTTPGVLFTTAVLGALPVAATQVALATTAGAAKGGAAVKAAGALSWSGVLAAPLMGLVANEVSRREALRHVRSPDEQKFIQRLYGASALLILLANFGVLFSIGPLRAHFPPGSHAVGRMLFAWTCLDLAGVAVLYLWARRRFIDYARNVRLPENASRWRRRLWFGADRALAYRSPLTLLGLPLLDIRFGHSAETPLARGKACGWIALGDVAHGVVFALGGVAAGGVAIGGIALGGISIGAVTVGIAAGGLLACGALANGMIAFGYVASGTLIAFGFEAAEGVIAVARHFARGGLFTIADHASALTSGDWAEAGPVMRVLTLVTQSPPIHSIAFLVRLFFTALLFPVLSALGMNFLIRFRGDAAADHPRTQARFAGGLALLLAFVAALVATAVKRASHRFTEESSAVVSHARQAVAHAANDQARAEARYTLGQALAHARRPAEALAEFLWCFDTGMPPLPRLTGTRTVSLLIDLRNLGETYPPALAALLARRDQAAAALLHGQAGFITVFDAISLNKVLGEPQRSVELYDRLPPASPLRPALGRLLFAEFLKARRYHDVAAAEPAGKIHEAWAARQRVEHQWNHPSFLPEVRQKFHDDNVHWLADRIEALAGDGQLDEARHLLTIALAYDPSASGLTTYRTGLEHAGQAALLVASPAPAIRAP